MALRNFVTSHTACAILFLTIPGLPNTKHRINIKGPYPSAGDEAALGKDQKSAKRYTLVKKLDTRWVRNHTEEAECIHTWTCQDNHQKQFYLRIYQELPVIDEGTSHEFEDDDCEIEFQDGNVKGWKDELLVLGQLFATGHVLRKCAWHEFIQPETMQAPQGYLFCILLAYDVGTQLIPLGDIGYETVGQDPKYKTAMLRALS